MAKEVSVIGAVDASLALHGAIMHHLGWDLDKQTAVIAEAFNSISNKPEAQEALRVYFAAAFK